jgi:hypothetical protein
MENRPDIWRHLKEHAIPPPPGVVERLRHALSQSAANPLQRLQQHSIPPPDSLKRAIAQQVLPKHSNRFRRIFPYAAAAGLLVIVAGAFFYNKVFIGARSAGPSVTLSSPDSHDKKHNNAGGDTASRLANRPTPTSDSSNAGIGLGPLDLVLDGEEFPLTENNLLATFTSFRYPAIKTHVDKRKNENSWRIRLDQYTNIMLSPAMVATLKDLYDLRPDGSPARKAKKTRQRLEKWADQDKKQFAPGYLSNPLDPIDLTEFLFPPFSLFGHRSPLPLPSGATGQKNDPGPSVDSAQTDRSPVTISYSLLLLPRKTSAGIGDTYNGGIQTLFQGEGQARLRLASLIRIQSILMSGNTGTFTILTESTRPKKTTRLNAGQWTRFNEKYDHKIIDYYNDTVSILSYPCKKAVIRLHDGRQLTAWYTPAIQSWAQSLLEPAFAGIPGLVLRYEYTYRRKTIQYTATTVSRRPIDPAVFVPSGSIQ